MKTINRALLLLAAIAPHPLNRDFVTVGAAWDEFEDDIAERGIQEDLVVRVREDGSYQCLRGHRRRYAGVKRGITSAWCSVVEATDEEAFDHMWGENLFRENTNPADEAKAVRAMLGDFGKTVEELAAKWHRSVEWIRTRQQLLELGDEVLEAVARPGRDRLTMGAVEEILKVPSELRGQAVQMVLHPDYELGTLDEQHARDVLKKCLIEPRAREAAWEVERKTVTKGWRKRLEALCLPKTKGDLMLTSKGLVEAAGLVRGYVAAEETVPLLSVLPDAPAGLRWLHLAVKHGLAVLVLPGEAGGESRAVVNQRMITDAEAALAQPIDEWVNGEKVRTAETGGEVWLVTGAKKCRVSSDQSSVEEADEETEKRVAKATADLEAGYDTSVEVEEKGETVIEQSMERCAMVRLRDVERLRDWAQKKVFKVPEDVDVVRGIYGPPMWALAMAADEQWEKIEQVCDWVLSLKV